VIKAWQQSSCEVQSHYPASHCDELGIAYNIKSVTTRYERGLLRLITTFPSQYPPRRRMTSCSSPTTTKSTSSAVDNKTTSDKNHSVNSSLSPATISSGEIPKNGGAGVVAEEKNAKQHPGASNGSSVPVLGPTASETPPPQSQQQQAPYYHQQQQYYYQQPQFSSPASVGNVDGEQSSPNAQTAFLNYQRNQMQAVLAESTFANRYVGAYNPQLQTTPPASPLFPGPFAGQNETTHKQAPQEVPSPHITYLSTQPCAVGTTSVGAVTNMIYQTAAAGAVYGSPYIRATPEGLPLSNTTSPEQSWPDNGRPLQQHQQMYPQAGPLSIPPSPQIGMPYATNPQHQPTAAAHAPYPASGNPVSMNSSNNLSFDEIPLPPPAIMERGSSTDAQGSSNGAEMNSMGYYNSAAANGANGMHTAAVAAAAAGGGTLFAQQPWYASAPTMPDMYPSSPQQQQLNMNPNLQRGYSNVSDGGSSGRVGHVGNQPVMGGYYLNAQSTPGPPIQTTSSNKGPEGANLFIFHIPNHFTNQDMYQLFFPYGSLLSVRIMVEKDTGRSRGFGFVSYDSPESAALAIKELNGYVIGNKRLKVQHKQIRPSDHHNNRYQHRQSNQHSSYHPSSKGGGGVQYGGAQAMEGTINDVASLDPLDADIDGGSKAYSVEPRVIENNAADTHTSSHSKVQQHLSTANEPKSAAKVNFPHSPDENVKAHANDNKDASNSLNLESLRTALPHLRKT